MKIPPGKIYTLYSYIHTWTHIYIKKHTQIRTNIPSPPPSFSHSLPPSLLLHSLPPSPVPPPSSLPPLPSTLPPPSPLSPSPSSLHSLPHLPPSTLSSLHSLPHLPPSSFSTPSLPLPRPYLPPSFHKMHTHTQTYNDKSNHNLGTSRN